MARTPGCAGGSSRATNHPASDPPHHRARDEPEQEPRQVVDDVRALACRSSQGTASWMVSTTKGSAMAPTRIAVLRRDLGGGSRHPQRDEPEDVPAGMVDRAELVPRRSPDAGEVAARRTRSSGRERRRPGVAGRPMNPRPSSSSHATTRWTPRDRPTAPPAARPTTNTIRSRGGATGASGRATPRAELAAVRGPRGGRRSRRVTDPMR